MRKTGGFTLIELLMVLVIVGILAAVAVPQYSGYVKKAKFSEVVAATAPYKLGVEDCYMRTATLTGCNAGSNGVPAAISSAVGYTATIAVANGVITATSTLTDGAATPVAYTYVLTPSSGTAAITWAGAAGNCDEAALC